MDQDSIGSTTDTLSRLNEALAGRYVIDGELGRGGMATVYTARDLRHDRRVAVKVLDPVLARSMGSERFLREIRIAASLRHPHIMPVYDSGEAEEMLYFVMPQIEGETLRSRLKREPRLPLDDALGIARQVADALAFAHDHGVVHRDIKPENILLESGHAVVADFGIARAVGAGPGGHLTATGMILGTPAYMAPEQVTGSEEPDGRSDIYSLGCMLYEMLSGVTPFSGPTPFAVLARHSNETAQSLSLLRDAIPQQVEAAIAKAMAKNPADRFANAAEFANALAGLGPRLTLPALEAPRRSRRAWLLGGLVVVALAAALWAGGLLRSGSVGGGTIRSLAVLPLQNLMHDSTQDYFVEGMHEAMIGSVSKIRSLRVISRTSVMRYQNTQANIPRIARELNVDAVIEGSVKREGNRVSISAALIRAKPEGQLWSQTYEGNLSDVLALHSAVALQVAQEISATLTPEDKRDLAGGTTVNPAAHEAYLRGRHAWREQTQPAVEQALLFFQRSIELDPRYAPAYAGRADCYILLSWAGLDPVPAAEAYPLAKAAALKALDLDSTLAEAHTSLAIVHWRYDWDWAGAEREFRRALELNPSDGLAHHWYGLFQAALKRPAEASANMERALELDPLSALIGVNRGWIDYFARSYDSAIVKQKQAVQLWPDFGAARYHLGIDYQQRGMRREALAALQEARTLSGDLPYLLAALGYAYGRAGQPAPARRILESLLRRPRLPPSLAAQIYVGLGERDQALAQLERAYAARDAYLVFLLADPVWDPLRSDPRFGGLLDKLGFQRRS